MCDEATTQYYVDNFIITVRNYTINKINFDTRQAPLMRDEATSKQLNAT